MRHGIKRLVALDEFDKQINDKPNISSVNSTKPEIEAVIVELKHPATTEIATENQVPDISAPLDAERTNNNNRNHNRAPSTTD